MMKGALSDLQEAVDKIAGLDEKLDMPEEVQEEIYNERALRGSSNINGREYHPLFKFITNQLYYGYAPIVLICGKYGRGKTNTGLELGRILHNEIGVCAGSFDPTSNMVYDVLEFLYFVRSHVRQVLLFDEAGNTLNSRQYYTDFNQAVEDTIEDQRFRQNVYVFMMGKAYELHPPIRKIVDLRLEMVSKATVEATIFKPRFGKMETGGKQRDEIVLRHTTNGPSNKWQPRRAPKEIRDKAQKKEFEHKHKALEDRIHTIEDKYKDDSEEPGGPIDAADLF